MEFKNLRSLSAQEQKEFLDSFDMVLLDCDGVIWYTCGAIPNAPLAVRKLRELGKQVRFVSNNTIYSLENFYKRLEKLDFEPEPGCFAVPTMAMIEYLRKTNFQKQLYVMGPPSLKSELEIAGFRVAPAGPGFVPGMHDLVQYTVDNPDVGAVVVDIDINLNFMSLMLAKTYLARRDVQLLYGATDKVLPMGPSVEGGPPVEAIGPHYFQHQLEKICGVRGIPFGKPGQKMADFIRAKFNITDPKRVLFVGDNLIQDIQFGNSSDYQTLLVLTGITDMDDLEEDWDYPDACKPNYYLNRFSELTDIIANVASMNKPKTSSTTRTPPSNTATSPSTSGFLRYIPPTDVSPPDKSKTPRV